jgi:hypothetical protein
VLYFSYFFLFTFTFYLKHMQCALLPFSSQEKERIAMPRLCEASGDAIPQRGGLGIELIKFVSFVFFV